MLPELCAGVAAGFTASMTRPEIRKWFRGDLYTIACYTIGTLMVLLFIVRFFLALGGRRDQAKLVAAGGLLGAGSVGAGVTLARVIAPDQESQDSGGAS